MTQKRVTKKSKRKPRRECPWCDVDARIVLGRPIVGRKRYICDACRGVRE
jgi:transposase-like protein